MYFIASNKISYQNKLELSQVQKTEWSLCSLNSKDFTRFFQNNYVTVSCVVYLQFLGVFCFGFTFTDILIKHLDKIFCTLLLLNSWVLVIIELQRYKYLRPYSIMCSMWLHCCTSSEVHLLLVLWRGVVCNHRVDIRRVDMVNVFYLILTQNLKQWFQRHFPHQHK